MEIQLEQVKIMIRKIKEKKAFAIANRCSDFNSDTWVRFPTYENPQNQIGRSSKEGINEIFKVADEFQSLQMNLSVVDEFIHGGYLHLPWISASTMDIFIFQRCG